MYTADMCPEGSIITIDQDDIQMYDQYDRLLANVYCDGKSVNSAYCIASMQSCLHDSAQLASLRIQNGLRPLNAEVMREHNLFSN